MCKWNGTTQKRAALELGATAALCLMAVVGGAVFMFCNTGCSSPQYTPAVDKAALVRYHQAIVADIVDRGEMTRDDQVALQGINDLWNE